VHSIPTTGSDKSSSFLFALPVACRPPAWPCEKLEMSPLKASLAPGVVERGQADRLVLDAERRHLRALAQDKLGVEHGLQRRRNRDDDNCGAVACARRRHGAGQEEAYSSELATLRTQDGRPLESLAATSIPNTGWYAKWTTPSR
jgi:hypothetical protein